MSTLLDDDFTPVTRRRATDRFRRVASRWADDVIFLVALGFASGGLVWLVLTSLMVIP